MALPLVVSVKNFLSLGSRELSLLLRSARVTKLVVPFLRVQALMASGVQGQTETTDSSFHVFFPTFYKYIFSSLKY